MVNTDNKFGTFNKRTQVLSQIDDGSTALINFATVAEAKTFFYTAEALAVHDECCTELQWALVGTTGLKKTMAFGTKGGNVSPADDWAEQFNSRKSALILSGNWNKKIYISTESDSHLF